MHILKIPDGLNTQIPPFLIYVTVPTKVPNNIISIISTVERCALAHSQLFSVGGGVQQRFLILTFYRY